MSEISYVNNTRIAADQLTRAGNSSAYFDTGNETANGSIPTPEVVSNEVQAAFTIILCGLIIFGTILGNSLICGAVAIARKLRTPSNLLIVSLAISDLLVGALDMPFAVMYEVTGTWSIGEVMCDFWTSIDVFFCTASILNICVISIDRYLVITKPFDYAMKRTPLRMLVMIALVWIVSAIISIPPLFGWKQSPAKPDECTVSQDMGYQFFATIGAFYLPLVIMLVIYSRIYMVSSRMTTSNVRLSGSSSVRSRPAVCSNGRHGNGYSGNLSIAPSNSTAATTSLFQHVPGDDRVSTAMNGDAGRVRNLSPISGGALTPVTSVTPPRKWSRTNSASLIEAIARLNCRRRGSRDTRSHERKATRTLGVIMGAFIACWLPFFILALIKPFCKDPVNCIPQWLNSLLLWLGYTNSLLNPIIYARFNREFRTPFKYILQCRCANINSHLRSEDFTEQFGRLPVSRHSSLLPQPISATCHAPAPSLTFLNSRHSSPNSPPPLSVLPPSYPSSITLSSRQSSLFPPALLTPSPTFEHHRLSPASHFNSPFPSASPLSSPSSEKMTESDFERLQTRIAANGGVTVTPELSFIDAEPTENHTTLSGFHLPPPDPQSPVEFLDMEKHGLLEEANLAEVNDEA